MGSSVGSSSADVMARGGGAGKLRAQRAKAMKFKDGYMISSGFPVNEYIDGAVRHVMLRQGVLGIKACGPAPPRLAYLCSSLIAPPAYGVEIQADAFGYR